MPSLVLMYHRVFATEGDPWSLCVSPERFAEHLAVVKRRAEPLPLPALWQGRSRSSGAAVALAFDDGYADNLLAAAPLLASAGVPATVFVTTGSVGRAREFWWDELEGLILRPGRLPRMLTLRVGGRPHSWDLGDAARYTDEAWQRHRAWRVSDPAPGRRQAFYLELWSLLQARTPEEQQDALDALSVWASVPRRARPEFRAMSLPELGRLAAIGGIEIGAHSVSHPVLPGLGPDAQRWELETSKARLEAFLGRAVTSLAYPHGARAPVTVEIARQAGYELACASSSGLVDSSTDPLQIPRMQVENWSGAEFERRLDAWLAGESPSAA